MTEKRRIEKKYNPKSISALARYLGLTSATVFGWRRGSYKVNGKTVENPKSKLKFELIQLGWEQLCKQNQIKD